MKRLLLIAAAIISHHAFATPADEVRAAEIAFAKSMADRDFTAFAGFIAEDAVFLNGGDVLHGKAAVLAHWKRFFEKPAAPFAWTPDLVAVDGSGTLGTTTGPVSAPDGTVGFRFYSTWRKEAQGWRVVFDNGYAVCPPPAK